MHVFFAHIPTTQLQQTKNEKNDKKKPKIQFYLKNKTLTLNNQKKY